MALDVACATMERILNHVPSGAPLVAAAFFAPWGLRPESLLGAGGECIAFHMAAVGVCDRRIIHLRRMCGVLAQHVYATNASTTYDDADTWQGIGTNTIWG